MNFDLALGHRCLPGPHCMNFDETSGRNPHRYWLGAPHGKLELFCRSSTCDRIKAPLATEPSPAPDTTQHDAPSFASVFLLILNDCLFHNERTADREASFLEGDDRGDKESYVILQDREVVIRTLSRMLKFVSLSLYSFYFQRLISITTGYLWEHSRLQRKNYSPRAFLLDLLVIHSGISFAHLPM